MATDSSRGGAQFGPKLNVSAWVPPTILLFALLAVWAGLSGLGVLDSFFFPSPQKVAGTLLQMSTSGELATALTATLGRVFLGFALGASVGVVAGLLMGESAFLRTLFDPWVSALYPLPKIALFPVLVLFLGVGEQSKVVIIALAVLFLTLINTMSGVQGISPLYFDVARNCGAGRWQVFRRVILPGSLPSIFAGLRLALGMALLMAVAVELVTARQGLGALLWVSWETMRTDKLYATLLVVSVVGWSLNAGLARLEVWAIPWREHR
ncbi:MAG: ABC transporter permease [Chloroflexi bacterium]|nr:ABC transporter permease [Chloroflexota bacterium]